MFKNSTDYEELYCSMVFDAVASLDLDKMLSEDLPPTSCVSVSIEKWLFRPDALLVRIVTEAEAVEESCALDMVGYIRTETQWPHDLLVWIGHAENPAYGYLFKSAAVGDVYDGKRA